MKGFPNQVADLSKLARGLWVIEELLASGMDPKDDAIFGAALVRARVAGTGHTKLPVERYLAQQELKPASHQSHRTTARGLRELYRLLQLVDDSQPKLATSDVAKTLARSSHREIGPPEIELWRKTISQFELDGSHPYQVLLRLIGRKPGIPRAKCALALEARDDSQSELDRIVALADLSESEIVTEIQVTQSNWDNAKKILPRFAEQLGDVIRSHSTYRLAEYPGRASDDHPNVSGHSHSNTLAAANRGTRRVTPQTIGQAGLSERQEPAMTSNIDPEKQESAKWTRADRLQRHNLLVRKFAEVLASAGMELFEDPFDTLAIREQDSILVEVKTLSGDPVDERDRVREALAQLLYYEAFVLQPSAKTLVHKVALFESEIAEAHRAWLNGLGIATIWYANGEFHGDSLAGLVVGRFLANLP